jgi:hypothetical protein
VFISKNNIDNSIEKGFPSIIMDLEKLIKCAKGFSKTMYFEVPFPIKEAL